MKRLTFLIVLVVAILGSIRIEAKADRDAQSYNMTRALEEMNNENFDAAGEYLAKELADNPKNSRACYWMSVIQFKAGDCGQAMSYVNQTIKYTPKKDNVYLGRAYASRAVLTTMAGDTITALDDYGKALKISPEDTEILEHYGQLLYELDRYDDADKIYNRIVAINPTSVMGYMGLGRDAHA